MTRIDPAHQTVAAPAAAGPALFAEVAIPVPVRQTFTYRIPAALDGRVVPGLPVNVPFGRRSAEGFVVSIGDSSFTP